MKLSQSTKKNIRQFGFLVLLLLTMAFILYYVPTPIREYLYLPLLVFVWQSKKDYFWLAFFFLMTDVPGGLFSGMEKIDPYGLPQYQFGGFSVSILELYYILILIKVINKPRINDLPRNYFKTELAAIIWLFIALIIVTVIMGTSYVGMKNLYKTMIYMTLFYSFYRMLDTQDKLFNFLRLLFPFSFLAVVLQLYTLIYHQQLVALFKPGVTAVQGVVQLAEGVESWVRPIELAHVLLVCFTATLFLVAYKKHSINRNYLLVVNLVSFFGILLTGTRSWVLAFVAGYFYFFIVTYKNTKLLVRWLLTSFVLIFILVYTQPTLLDQVEKIWTRLITVEDLVEGDLTAGGTMQRLDVRGPKVFEAFEQSTLFFGAGFSDHFYYYADGHVGYHNILFNAGYIGSAIFLIFILRLLIAPFMKRGRQKNIDLAFLKVSILPLIVLLIINSGTQTIGFTPDGSNRVFLMSFAFVLVNMSLYLTRTKELAGKTIPIEQKIKTKAAVPAFASTRNSLK